MHTGEKAVIAYKRDGEYIPAGLERLNHILRDWRENKQIEMDPRLMDLLWEVYRKSGSRDDIHVICGYRTGDTNEMLRGRSRASGVAKQSQHTLGRAIDFYLPDVSLAKLREIGMTFQVGGVGFYPQSGSPFLHVDTGFVRAWPRMSRDQLVRLFPDGRTLHLPPDGKPLPGYEAALASYKRRVTGDSVIVAGGRAVKNRPSGNMLAALFGGGKEANETGASGVVEANPALRGVDASSKASHAGLLPEPSRLPLPRMRPIEPTEVASNAPLGALPVPDAAAPLPVPDLPPRDAGAGNYPESFSSPAEAAVIAEANLSSVRSAAPAAQRLPLPGLRPELTAYAGSGESKLVVAQMVSANPATGADDVTGSIRRKLTRGQIIVASLASMPSERPRDLPAAARPMHFRIVDGGKIRGGRVIRTGESDSSGVEPLSQDVIERWARGRKAMPYGPSDDRVTDSRVSRIAAWPSGERTNAARAVDPQRFAAVSDYFP